MTLFRKSLIPGLILGLALPLAATAQTTPAPRPAAATAAPHAARGEETFTPAQMSQRMERHLAQLHTQLGITPMQQPQWEQFAKTTRDNATDLHTRFQLRGSNLGTLSAADNMADYAQISELHAQQLSRLAGSFRTLYLAMSDDQKKAADAVFRVARPPIAAPRA